MIQVPVDQQLKKRVEKRAENDGFSSLQQLIRLVLAKYDSGRLEVGMHEVAPVKLSPAAIKRYDKMTGDFKKGRNIFVAESVEDLMDQLNGVKNPVPFKVSKALPKKDISKQRVGQSL